MPRVLTVLDICCIAPQDSLVQRDPGTGCIIKVTNTYGFGKVIVDYVEVGDDLTVTHTAEDL